MKTKNIIILIAIHVLTLSFCFGQSRYAFEATSQAYTHLENPNILNDSSYPNFYDDIMVEVDFPIYYFGKKLYSVLVKNRGEIVFGNTEERIELFPVQLKLKSDSRISYKVEGESNCGNRILKIEYQNMGFRCDTSDLYFANAQLWIYERTGVLEIHFGESLDNPDIYRINANNCYGAFYYGTRLRFHPRWSAMPFKDPDQPSFTQGNLSDVNFQGIGAIPSAGILYRFEPIAFSVYQSKLSPNPARLFTIVSRPLDCGEFQINVFDTKGQLFIQEEFTNSTQYLDTSGLVPGIYFVQIRNKENREKYVEKLLIL